MSSRIQAPAMMAEFDSGPALIDGVRALRERGVAPLETFTPYEVEGLDAAMGTRRSRLGWIVLAAGLCAGAAAYGLQWWINVVDYPLNLGGRPDHAAPAFIPITFEMTVLFAGAAALISALVLGGLPRLWHPVFEVDGFDRATIDRFWLAAEVGARLEVERDTAALEAAGALRVVWLHPPGGRS